MKAFIRSYYMEKLKEDGYKFDDEVGTYYKKYKTDAGEANIVVNS